MPSIAMNLGNGNSSPAELVNVLKIVLLLTVLTLAPAIIVMMTSFTRVVIVLSFLRQSLGAQQMPPNQVVVGLSLFLSLFIMAPTWTRIQTDALNPYLEERIDQKTAFSRAETPMREFMFAQVREKDLELVLGAKRSGNFGCLLKCVRKEAVPPHACAGVQQDRDPASVGLGVIPRMGVFEIGSCKRQCKER